MKCKEVLRLKNKRMKIARVECDFSQEQLAEEVGVT
ncbi:MAG: putative transcriptional regulator, partial [Clostridium sp.]